MENARPAAPHVAGMSVRLAFPQGTGSVGIPIAALIAVNATWIDPSGNFAIQRVSTVVPHVVGPEPIQIPVGHGTPAGVVATREAPDGIAVEASHSKSLEDSVE